LGIDGAFLTGEIQLSTFTINNQQDPVCSFLSTGGPADQGFVAAWVHMGDADGWAVHFRTFSNLGFPTTAVQQANINVWGNQMNPVVAPLGNGGFIIVWESSVQPGYNGGAIVARLYDSTGNPTTGEV
jgi:hypothetical protein